jgi:hypothetical protein
MGLGSGILDPRSEIRDPEKNLFRIRVQGQKGTGSRIRIRNTGMCVRLATTPASGWLMPATGWR